MKRAKSQTPKAKVSPKLAAPLHLRLLVVFGSVLVAVALLEGLVRILRLAPRIFEIGVTAADSYYRRSENAILGYELRPGARADSAFVNAQGMFGRERPVKKPPGTRRILLLGDSVLEPYDKTVDQFINSRMEQLYEAAGSGSAETAGNRAWTEVLNLGVGGYNTLMEVEALRVKGLQFEPDVVIMVFVENDFDNITEERTVLSGVPRPAWVNWAFRRVQLFRLLCVRLDWFSFRSDADPLRRGWEAVGTNNVARALPRFKELSLKHQFEPWIAVWPRFRDQDVTNVHFLGDGQTLVIEALAGMSDIPTHRLSEHFNAHLQSLVRPVNPRQEWTCDGDGMHPNAEGAKIAAQALKAMLDASPRPTTRDPMAWRAKAEAALGQAQALGNKRIDYLSSLLQFGKWEEESANLTNAVSYYEAVLRIDSNNVEAHFRLGRVLLKTGARARAVEHLHRALEIRPNQTEARELLRQLTGQGDPHPPR